MVNWRKGAKFPLWVYPQKINRKCLAFIFQKCSCKSHDFPKFVDFFRENKIEDFFNIFHMKNNTHKMESKTEGKKRSEFLFYWPFSNNCISLSKLAVVVQTEKTEIHQHNRHRFKIPIFIRCMIFYQNILPWTPRFSKIINCPKLKIHYYDGGKIH